MYKKIKTKILILLITLTMTNQKKNHPFFQTLKNCYFLGTIIISSIIIVCKGTLMSAFQDRNGVLFLLQNKT